MDILEIIEQVYKSAELVAKSLQKQSFITKVISDNLSQTLDDTRVIEKSISNVLEGVDRTEATAQQVLDISTVLGAQSETLKQKMDDFLYKVRN